ncbi:MAG TPA: hypothetical protein VN176_13560 [Verrucomicrobiae bacterium]|jgi:hypothetical protein|nr:hypothetical protein [Verrucomicrobiae bacterium]
MRKVQAQFILAGSLLGGTLAFAQAPPVANLDSSSATIVDVAAPAIQPVTPPCAKPAATFDIDDYNGPFSSLVGSVSQKVELKTVHLPQHHRPGARPCSLDASDKFHLFVENTFEPINFMGAGWDAGWAQLDKDDPSFGQGVGGYSKRYAAAVTDNVADDFFSTFLYPSLFHQDPRYYRLGHGSVPLRFGHALRHVFVAHSDSGQLMPNYSEWLGTASSKALSNLYHPGNERGFGSTASRAGFSIATDAGWDVFREFWPEIAHKCHLPFKNDYAQNHPVLRDADRPALAPTVGEKSAPAPTVSVATLAVQ